MDCSGKQFLDSPCTHAEEALDDLEFDHLEVNLHDPSQMHLCAHIFHDGSLCRDIAISGETYCRWHATASAREQRNLRWNKKRRANAIERLNIPTIEDAYSHQLAMQQVLDAILDGRLRGREAGHVLYWMQISQHNIQGKVNIPRRKFTESDLKSVLRMELREFIEEERQKLEAAKSDPLSPAPLPAPLPKKRPKSERNSCSEAAVTRDS